MTVWFNRVMFTPTAGGTGHFVVSAAVTGYLTPAAAGVPDNAVVDYTAESSDKSQWETGIGTYVSGTTALQRSTIRESTNGGAAVNFSSPPSVWIDLHAQSINQVVQDTSPELGGDLNLNSFGLLVYSADSPGSQAAIIPIKTIAVPVAGQGLGFSFDFTTSDSPTLPMTAAMILAEVDGAPGDNDMPGRMSFWTTPDASAAPSERMRIDSNGRMIVNHTTAESVQFSDIPRIQSHESAEPSLIGLYTWSNDSTGSSVYCLKSRSATIGTHTVVQSGDSLAYWSFGGSDGGEFIEGASFGVKVDGAPGDNDMPGRMVFATTADGGTVATERMRIDSSGNVNIGSAAAASRRFHVNETNATTNAVTYVDRLQVQSSGTPAAGIGVGVEFVAETAADNHEIGATIEAATTDVTSTSEDFDLVFKLMIAGAAAAEVARFPSTGGIQLATGTLPTAVSNTIEFDDNCLYGCTDASNRGYIPIRHFIRADSTRTLPNDTNENAIFNSPANGRLTLETGAYFFEGIIRVSSMSATSGNALIDILGAGTATIGSWLWWYSGIDATDPSTPATNQSGFRVTQDSAASIVTAGTGTAMAISIKGTMEVTGAGTVIPSIDLVTAAAGIVSVGSYICFERIGSTSVASVGQWD